MSRIRRMMELTPPTAKTTEETLVSVGHACGYCHGNGWFWKMKDDEADAVKEPCPLCNGKGEVDAVITIKWQPTQPLPSPPRKGRGKTADAIGKEDE